MLPLNAIITLTLLKITHAECGRPTLAYTNRSRESFSKQVVPRPLNIPKGTMKYYQNAITSAIENAITNAIQISITNAV